MGLQDVMDSYQPKENQEFGGRKKLVGDAVCQVTLIEAGKTKKWYILKSEVINAIPDVKGRPTTVEVGDEISNVYDPEDDKDLQSLRDDLFTAGISFEKGVDAAATFKAMQAAVEGKLVYFKTYVHQLTDEEKKKYPKNTTGYWQKIKVLSASKITPENSTPQVAF